MTWVKLTDTFAEDPRLHDAGPEAFTLHVAALCYCSRRLTDGFVPATMASILWPLKDVTAAVGALIANGLWAERDGGGYEILDYLDDQPSAEKVKQRQAQAKARFESWKARQGKGATHSQRVANGVANAAPSRPDPTPKGRDGFGTDSAVASSARPAQLPPGALGPPAGHVPSISFAPGSEDNDDD